MSSSNGPIKWTWPAPGEDTPPYSVEALFGPVARGDDIVLKFSPASYTGPLTLYCAWQGGQQGIVWNITGNTGSPHTYTFNETTPDGDDVGDLHICHFFAPGDSSPGGSGGNTQTFKYFDTPAKQATLWQQSGSSPKASASASATASPSSTPGVASEPQVTPQPSGPAITTGAAIGITLGAIALLVAIGVLVFMLRRRSRRRRQEQATVSGPMPPMNQQPYEHYNDKPGPNGPQAPPYSAHGQTAYGAPMRGYSTKRVGELEGQQRVEMDEGRSPGPVIRSELPGS